MESLDRFRTGGSKNILVVVGALLLAACGVMEDELTSVSELPSHPTFPDNSTESFYLTMRDGVRIAVDLHLPQPLWFGAEVPTIVSMTRYWRSEEAGENRYMGWRIQEATRRGFAFISTLVNLRQSDYC